MPHSRMLKDFDKTRTQWFEAAKTGQPSQLKPLMRYHGQRDIRGWTGLMQAAANGNAKNVALLLEDEKNTHSPTNFTALMAAVQAENIQIASMLTCQTKVRVLEGDPQFKAGTTALVIAMELGNRELFELLSPFETEEADLSEAHILAFQHCGAKLGNQKFRMDILGRSPLHYAVMVQERTEPYRLMLKKLCTHPDTKHLPACDKYGMSPLHYAVVYQNTEAAAILAPYFSSVGTTLNNKDYPVGTTPLMFAAALNLSQFITILSQFSVDSTNAKGDTAASLLKSTFHGAPSTAQRQMLNLLSKTSGVEDQSQIVVQLLTDAQEQVDETIAHISNKDAVVKAMAQLLRSQGAAQQSPEQPAESNIFLNSSVGHSTTQSVLATTQTGCEKQLRQRNVELEQQIVRYGRKIADLEKTHEALVTRFSELQYVNTRLQEDKLMQDGECERRDTRIQALEAMQHDLQTAAEAGEIQVKNLEAIRSSLETDMKTLRIQLDAASAENDYSKAKIEQQTTQIRQLTKTIQALEGESVDAIELRAKLASHHQEMNAQLDALQRQNEELTTQNSTMATQLAVVAEHRDSLLVTLHQKEAEISEVTLRLTNELEDKNAHIKRLQSNLEDVSLRTKQLEDMLQAISERQPLDTQAQVREQLVASKIKLLDLKEDQNVISRDIQLTESLEASLKSNVEYMLASRRASALAEMQATQQQSELEQLRRRNEELEATKNDTVNYYLQTIDTLNTKNATLLGGIQQLRSQVQDDKERIAALESTLKQSQIQTASQHSLEASAGAPVENAGKDAEQAEAAAIQDLSNIVSNDVSEVQIFKLTQPCCEPAMHIPSDVRDVVAGGKTKNLLVTLYQERLGELDACEQTEEILSAARLYKHRIALLERPAEANDAEELSDDVEEKLVVLTARDPELGELVARFHEAENSEKELVGRLIRQHICVQELLDELKARDAEMESLVYQLEAVNDNDDELQMTIEMDEKLYRKDTEAAVLRSQVEELQEQLSQKMGPSGAPLRQSSAGQAPTAESEHVANLEQQLAQREADLVTVQQRLEAAQLAAETAEKRQAQLQTELDEVQRQNSEYQQHVLALAEDIDVLRTDNEQLSQDRQSLTEEIVSIEAIKAAILDECSEAKAELYRINQLIQQHGQGANGVAALQRKLMEVDARFKDLKGKTREWLEKMK